MDKSCKTCRRAACREYGKDMGICEKYIPSLESLKKQEKEETDKILEICDKCVDALDKLIKSEN